MRWALVLLLPATLLAQSTKTAQERLREEIERTKAAFQKAISALQQKKEALTEQLKALDERVSSMRSELDEKAAKLRRLTEQEAALKEEVSRYKEELKQLKERVGQVALAVQEASRAIFPVQVKIEKGMKGLLDALWGLWKAGTSVRVETEKVVCRDGVVRDARVLRVGRIARLWTTSDGRAGLGAISPESPTHWEDVEVEGKLAQYIKRVFTDMEQNAEVVWVPVDASRRVTARGLLERVGFWEQLRRGGVVMIPIGLVGVVGLILCVVVGLRLGGGNLREGVEGSAAWRVRRRLEMFKDAGSAKMHEVLAESVDEELVRFERGLGAVGVCAAVAPLLGLLGTVVGMIRTFETIASFGAQDARLLAGGIREALITTEAGLAVAIPLLLLHALLRGRAESLAERLREQGEHLIQKIAS